jgi:inorganic pyrophosphatase
MLRERVTIGLSVAAYSRYSDEDLNLNRTREIEQFFVNYNQKRGKKFKIVGKQGPRKAFKLVKKSLE